MVESGPHRELDLWLGFVGEWSGSFPNKKAKGENRCLELNLFYTKPEVTEVVDKLHGARPQGLMRLFLSTFGFWLGWWLPTIKRGTDGFVPAIGEILLQMAVWEGLC